MTGWTERARAAIMRLHATLPANATPAERKRALREAYPFAARSGWAYKAWLREQKKYLARFPDPSKLKDSPLFRAARGLSADKPKRVQRLRYRRVYWDAQGLRLAVFTCQRCDYALHERIDDDKGKLARHPCPHCNGAAQ